MWGNLRISMPQLRGRVTPHLKGIAESTLAQAFNLFGIIAGYILADSFGVFNQHPWALLIFPGLLSNRVAIGGLFSGRLSTGLHLGTFLPKMRENTEYTYQLYSAVVALTGLSALLIVIGGGVFSLLTYRDGLKELFQLFLVVFTTLGLSRAQYFLVIHIIQLFLT